MPELPEVENVARKLRPRLVGRTILETHILWPGVVDRPSVIQFREMLRRADIVDVRRRGKFLSFHLDFGHIWFTHLRMTGKYFVQAAAVDAGDDPHARARFLLDDGTWLVFSDTRKFGRFYLVHNAAEVVGNLGPEPLGSAFTAEWLAQQLAGRRGEIKRLLLNQEFLAGLGNIYVSEALWQAGVHPERIAGTLTVAEITRLHTAIRLVLDAGIANGGTSLGDRQYVYPDGGLGRHQERLVVYDRAGDLCPRCGYAIERIVQGQRSTYYCPRCQSLPTNPEGLT
ncbi:MAG: bifunctional DNA-formamidopyrimidine glycosylase/DNA-(apurinic or apyrimidinic site) lyase [Anaerolineae bacterium]|nr:bifunctional DNA-formamidopyrimidine glycosylase/DNA-(apurinic or apyrimidinic site) lyase [Anaerolineae bacterium]